MSCTSEVHQSSSAGGVGVSAPVGQDGIGIIGIIGIVGMADMLPLCIFGVGVGGGRLSRRHGSAILCAVAAA